MLDFPVGLVECRRGGRRPPKRRHGVERRGARRREQDQIVAAPGAISEAFGVHRRRGPSAQPYRSQLPRRDKSDRLGIRRPERRRGALGVWSMAVKRRRPSRESRAGPCGIHRRQSARAFDRRETRQSVLPILARRDRCPRDACHEEARSRRSSFGAGRLELLQAGSESRSALPLT